MKKKLSMLLVIPILLFSQNQTYPDTVILDQGKVIPCIISKLDEEKIILKYGDHDYESGTGIVNVKKIVLDEKGIIYKKTSGFLSDFNSIEKYILKRKTFLAKQKRKQEKAKRKKQFSKNLSQINGKNKKDRYEYENANLNHLSFGIFYVPIYSSNFIFVAGNYGDVYLQYVSSNASMIEGQFSYRLTSRMNFTFDIGYTSLYAKIRNETHTDYADGDQYDYGEKNMASIKSVVFNVGFKFYFNDLMNHKVSPYLLIGGGKQIAFYNEENEELFNDTPTSYTVEDNKEEFIKQINSPININCGFGVEYSFNESLSLFSNIRLFNTKYNAKYVSDSQTRNKIVKLERSEINTRIGLGLNFYF
jgi:hypothetical protein